MKRALLFLVFLMLISVGALSYFGGKPGRICESLKPGIDEQELIAALGAPQTQEEKTGFRELTFKSNLAAAGSIRARVDPRTKKVLLLSCWEDGPATWEVPAQ